MWALLPAPTLSSCCLPQRRFDLDATRFSTYPMSTDSIPHRSIAIDEFMPMVGQKLLADCAPKVAELELVEVQPLKLRFGDFRRHSGPRQPLPRFVRT